MLLSNVTQFVQSISKVVAGSKAGSGVKAVLRPTCGEVMVRHQPKSTQRSSMIRALISQSSPRDCRRAAW